MIKRWLLCCGQLAPTGPTQGPPTWLRTFSSASSSLQSCARPEADTCRCEERLRTVNYVEDLTGSTQPELRVFCSIVLWLPEINLLICISKIRTKFSNLKLRLRRAVLSRIHNPGEGSWGGPWTANFGMDFFVGGACKFFLPADLCWPCWPCWLKNGKKKATQYQDRVLIHAPTTSSLSPGEQCSKLPP